MDKVSTCGEVGINKNATHSIPWNNEQRYEILIDFNFRFWKIEASYFRFSQSRFLIAMMKHQ